MKILDINDIDYEKLDILDVLSTESTIYFDDELIYKFYDNLPLATLERKRKKLFLLNEGEEIPDAIIPNILIKNKNILIASGMKRIINGNSLIKYKNTDIFILLLYVISLSLKKIHNDPRNIAVGDLHFNNILIDDKGKHYFIDFDSCAINGIIQDRLPRSLKQYALNRGDFDFEVSHKTDKLCMLLSFVNSLFGKEIDTFSLYEYDKKAEQVQTLKNLREIFLNIKKNNIGIPNVPYLDEFISISDFPGKKLIKK